MSEYTREQIIEKITNGESFQGVDLSGIDVSEVDFRSNELGGPCEKPADFSRANLHMVNLNSANLSGANLSGAALSDAELCGIDLHNADLSQADLHNADLENADLHGANFNQADLHGADLKKADLHGAHLQGANLQGARIQGGHLGGAYLQKANLQNVNIRWADLHEANLRDATLIEADLQGACLKKANLTGANILLANLVEADLTEIDLHGVNLCDTKLRAAKLRGNSIIKANLRLADLRGADLRDTDLSISDLEGADLSGARLNKANLSGAFLEGANFEKANLEKADFSGDVLNVKGLGGANLSGANLKRANLSGDDLHGVDLSGANLEKANLNKTNLSGADLTDVDMRYAQFSFCDLSDVTITGAKVFGAGGALIRSSGLICKWLDKSKRGDGSDICYPGSRNFEDVVNAQESHIIITSDAKLDPDLFAGLCDLAEAVNALKFKIHEVIDTLSGGSAIAIVASEEKNLIPIVIVLFNALIKDRGIDLKAHSPAMLYLKNQTVNNKPFTTLLKEIPKLNDLLMHHNGKLEKFRKGFISEEILVHGESIIITVQHNKFHLDYRQLPDQSQIEDTPENTTEEVPKFFDKGTKNSATGAIIAKFFEHLLKDFSFGTSTCSKPSSANKAREQFDIIHTATK